MTEQACPYRLSAVGSRGVVSRLLLTLPVQTIGFVVGPSYPVETKALGLLALWAAAAASSIAAWQLPACRDSDGAEQAHR